jgi:hypothetical protein
MQENAAGMGHNNPPVGCNPAPWLVGARAVIRRRKPPVGTAGRAGENDWILSFERRTPPEIDELMGWTGGVDTLATEVRLTFASRAEALAYAESQALDYDVEAEPERVPQASFVTPRFWARCGRHAFGKLLVPRTRSPVGQNLEDHTAPGTSSPDLKRALVNPAAIFSAPEAVLNRPGLKKECKQEILRRWAWDEYLKEVAASEGMADGGPSRLEEVKRALLSLGEVWRPKPNAPAAAVPSNLGELAAIAA